MADAGLIVLVALVSPFRTDRERVAALVPQGRFVEVFGDTPIDICRQRDTKGLYAKADRGLVSDVAGRDQGYEAPVDPAMVLRTVELSPQDAADRLAELILEKTQLR